MTSQQRDDHKMDELLFELMEAEREQVELNRRKKDILERFEAESERKRNLLRRAGSQTL